MEEEEGKKDEGTPTDSPDPESPDPTQDQTEEQEEKEEETTKKLSEINKRKMKILRSIQNLFAQMQEGDLNATSTEEVTTAFGWNNDGDSHVRE